MPSPLRVAAVSLVAALLAAACSNGADGEPSAQSEQAQRTENGAKALCLGTVGHWLQGLGLPEDQTVEEEGSPIKLTELACVDPVKDAWATSACVQTAGAWVSASVAPLLRAHVASLACGGNSAPSTVAACLSEAWQWTDASANADHRRDVAARACRGDSQAAQVRACLDNAWAWTTAQDPNHRRLVAGTACGYRTAPAKVAACLQAAWNIALVRESTPDERRLLAARSCKEGKISLPLDAK